jgi:hypothetical protein
MSKVEKLNELNELHKSGAISKEEFDSLKKEILESKESLSPTKKEETTAQPIINKQQINLKSFRDSDGNLVKAPEITHIDFKNITSEENKVLKPFLRKKHIHASYDMTEDEITLGKKLFTSYEIHSMESERPGFNYAFGSIISLLAGIAAAIFLYISPCMIIFCYGGLAASVFIAGFTLTRVNATKMDKIVCGLALAADAVGIFFYIV